MRAQCLNLTRLMFATAVLLAASAVALAFAKRLNLGSIVALIAVGAMLGPHSAMPLITEHVDEMQTVGEIGVMLLLFVVGLDIEPGKLWSMRRFVMRLGAAQYAFTVTAIAVLLRFVAGLPWQAALIAGLALAMGSDAIPLPILQARREGRTPHGRATVAVTIFQSLMVVPVLAVIPLLGPAASHGDVQADAWKALRIVAAIAAVYALGRFVLPRALARTARDLGSGAFSLVVLAGVLAAASIMEWVGVSMALGAFLVGVLLSTTIFADQVKAAATPAKQILLALFFIAIGMATDLKQIASMGPRLLAYLPLLLGVKLALVFLLARAFRMERRSALLTGLLLMPFDEVAYVILHNAKVNAILDASGYATGLAMISASFIVSPPLITLGYRLADRLRAGTAAARPTKPIPPGRVVVVGYGSAGRAVCVMLERAGMAYVAFATDLEGIRAAERWHHHVRYGDLADLTMLATVGIASARAVIVTTGAPESARTIVANLRRFYPDVAVMTAVGSLAERDAIRQLGTPNVLPLATEGTLHFGRSVLESLGVDAGRCEAIVGALRSDDYAVLRGIVAGEPPLQDELPAAAAPSGSARAVAR